MPDTTTPGPTITSSLPKGDYHMHTYKQLQYLQQNPSSTNIYLKLENRNLNARYEAR